MALNHLFKALGLFLGQNQVRHSVLNSPNFNKSGIESLVKELEHSRQSLPGAISR